MNCLVSWNFPWLKKNTRTLHSKYFISKFYDPINVHQSNQCHPGIWCRWRAVAMLKTTCSQCLTCQILNIVDLLKFFWTVWVIPLKRSLPQQPKLGRKKANRSARKTFQTSSNQRKEWSRSTCFLKRDKRKKQSHYQDNTSIHIISFTYFIHIIIMA